MASKKRFKLGVSACLLGEKVRFDGGHKSSSFTRSLGQFFELVPFCPEVGIGLGTPRKSLRLVGSVQNPRLLQPATNLDLTDEMMAWSEKTTAEIDESEFVGFVFKKGSPSCAMERTRVYAPNGMPEKAGVGLFAKHTMERFPELAFEDEGRLNDATLRSRFIMRLFARARVLELFRDSWTIGQLVAFHSREKYLLLAHSPLIYKELGRMVARAMILPLHELERQYKTLYLDAFTKVPSPGRHLNVLQHMLGYFKKFLGPIAKQSILNAVTDYRQGFLPLSTPLNLLKHYSLVHEQNYLLSQTYFQPFDKDLQVSQTVLRV
ncbi:MAG: DUF523 and DUF1722 domain-containing protein [Planctomycetota bacterium]|nr:DUF523 and DUF1722 domain-containing protein [Planctomycetota bacterium]